jgi:hypothetical protein
MASGAVQVAYTSELQEGTTVLEYDHELVFGQETANTHHERFLVRIQEVA